MKYKNHFPTFIFLIFLGFGASSCNSSGNTANEEGTSSSMSDSGDRILDKKAFEAGMKKKNAVLIDVRMAQNFEKGALENAINIDFFSPTFKTDLLDLDRSKEYYLYCKNEQMSYRTMTFMDKNDFKHVYILKGGYEKWNSADNE